jgi:uncharacterized protein YbjT (DUF2867 family)
MKTALIVGATGLIGKQVLQLLLSDSHYHKIVTITRKPLDITHQKHENIIVDFDKLSACGSSLKTDDVFCCLGTTIRIAKTKEAFRKVDFDYPVEVARLAKKFGVEQYLLVSALGADKHSKIFYNRVKGEVEDAITQVGFRTLHIFRPSLLLGKREEERAGEGAATVFFKLFGFLVPRKYKAIDSAKVARAMLDNAKSGEAGVFIHESHSIQGY